MDCFVQPGTSKLIIEESDSGGLRRVTEIVPTKVYFFADPSLNAEDLIYFADPAGRAHWYKVMSVHAPCATSVLWMAEVQETR